MPPFSTAIKSAMTNRFTRTGVNQRRFPVSYAMTCLLFRRRSPNSARTQLPPLGRSSPRCRHSFRADHAPRSRRCGMLTHATATAPTTPPRAGRATGWRTHNNGHEYSAPWVDIFHLGHADQDLVLMVLISRAFSEVWNRYRAPAYISPLASAPGMLHNVHSRDTDTTGPAPALTSVMTPAATAALMV